MSPQGDPKGVRVGAYIEHFVGDGLVVAALLLARDEDGAVVYCNMEDYRALGVSLPEVSVPLSPSIHGYTDPSRSPVRRIRIVPASPHEELARGTVWMPTYLPTHPSRPRGDR